MKALFEKIIIENRTIMDMEDIFPFISSVMSMGRISNNNTQYCYVTSFRNGLVISALKNKNSDRFVVFMKEEEK